MKKQGKKKQVTHELPSQLTADQSVEFVKVLRMAIASEPLKLRAKKVEEKPKKKKRERKE